LKDQESNNDLLIIIGGGLISLWLLWCGINAIIQGKAQAHTVWEVYMMGRDARLMGMAHIFMAFFTSSSIFLYSGCRNKPLVLMARAALLISIGLYAIALTA
jgi:hypothetical protein